MDWWGQLIFYILPIGPKAYRIDINSSVILSFIWGGFLVSLISEHCCSLFTVRIPARCPAYWRRPVGCVVGRHRTTCWSASGMLPASRPSHSLSPPSLSSSQPNNAHALNWTWKQLSNKQQLPTVLCDWPEWGTWRAAGAEWWPGRSPACRTAWAWRSRQHSGNARETRPMGTVLMQIINYRNTGIWTCKMIL